jgi:hypothetical protein
MFFNESPQFKRKRGQPGPKRELHRAERPTKALDFLTYEEIRASVGNEYTVDVECAPNFFFVGMKHKASGKVTSVELSPDVPVLDRDLLGFILFGCLNVTFNGNKYDMLMMFGAMSGLNNESLKELNDFIILEGATAYDVQKRYGFRVPRHINHIDLIEVAPLSESLKTYAGRLHCKRMQDLPFSPNDPLTAENAMITRHYCINDLDNTELLRDELRPHIELREKLGNEFELDLRSMSDAQLAEKIICREYHRITGEWPKRPGFFPGATFKYEAPSYIAFRTPTLQKMLADILGATITVGESGHVECPPEIEGVTIQVGDNIYKIGMGGLHSQEKSQTIRADSEYGVFDRDVTGYYPNLILKNGFYPKHLGLEFLTALQSIVDKRYAAKKAKEMVTADSLKIASNGTFGKLSDPYSTMYDPKMMVQTTLTGQLSLLMIIEYLEEIGIRVMSANTDGIVIHCLRGRYAEMVKAFQVWEQITKLETEETEYTGLYSRDVNNYFAVKPDGEVKSKGVYTEKGSALNSRLSKNPESLICSDAVKAFLSKGASIESFIRDSRDIRRFVSIRKVKGGAHKDGEYLGKVVRFYYSKEERGCIQTVESGGKVPKTDGARPLMDLPDSIPSDLNYEYYVKEATDILHDIGYFPKPKQAALFF